MAHSQINKICVEIFENAAHCRAEPKPRSRPLAIFTSRLPSLKHESWGKAVARYTPEYQSRLTSNAASSKCHMCALIAQNIPQLLKPLHLEEERLNLSLYKPKNSRETTYLMIASQRKLGETSYQDTLPIRRCQCSKALCMISKLNYLDKNNSLDVHVLSSPRTCSFEALKAIRSWMKTCNSSHTNCKISQTSSRLPLRLIDVIPEGPNGIQDIENFSSEDFNRLGLGEFPGARIRLSKDMPFKPSYLTLSHRWASPPSILLTRQSNFLLNEDISTHLLQSEHAAVFRHAIHVTRCLGARFLWIDALCIMQDDNAEKTEEIMFMDEIYFNSTLNISATEGTSNGLDFDRNTLTINPCRTVIIGSETQREINLEAFSEKCSLRVSEGSLNKRGWVFQERTLAPRIVHFTKDQVFWECHSLEASETLPQGRPGPKPPTSKCYIFHNAPGGISSQQMRQQWYDLVAEYSRTQLSFTNDRLLAISGVAKRYGLAMRLEKSNYLAGIWKEGLPLSLLWFQNDPERVDWRSVQTPPDSNAAETELAPSWSWASITGGVMTVNGKELSAIPTVVGTWIERRSPNIFDGVNSCRLRLRGPVCKLRRRILDGKAWLYVNKNTAFQEQVESYGIHKGRTLLVIWDMSRASVAECLEDDDDPSSSIFYLLYVATESRGAKVLVRENLLKYGIILRRTNRRGSYIRAGYFTTLPHGQYENIDLENILNGRLCTLEHEDYLGVDANMAYTIDII